MKRVNTLGALLLTLAFVTPQAFAQCNTQNPVGSPGVFVVRYFTPDVMGCDVAMNNAYLCSVIGTNTYNNCGGGSCILVAAQADPAATMQESCSFTCTIPSFCSLVIDGPNDGLPVELMEFSLDADGEDTAAEEAEPDA